MKLLFMQGLSTNDCPLPPCAGRVFSRLYPPDDAAMIDGMTWLEMLFRTVVAWLFEIPPDLLGRKVERLLDGAAERNRRRRASSRRKLPRRRREGRPRR
jgi:hypothetical protein